VRGIVGMAGVGDRAGLGCYDIMDTNASSINEVDAVGFGKAKQWRRDQTGVK
jgi:hypothetical protein